MNPPPKTKEERSQCCKAEIWQCKTGAFGSGEDFLACSNCYKHIIPQDQEECICYEQERNGEFNFKCSKCNRLVFSRLISSPDLKEDEDQEGLKKEHRVFECNGTHMVEFGVGNPQLK